MKKQFGKEEVPCPKHTQHLGQRAPSRPWATPTMTWETLRDVQLHKPEPDLAFVTQGATHPIMLGILCKAAHKEHIQHLIPSTPSLHL